MKTAFTTHRTIISAIGAAAVVAVGLAGFGPGNSAHAEGDRLGNFEIQRLMASASDTSSQQVMEVAESEIQLQGVGHDKGAEATSHRTQHYAVQVGW